MHKRGQQKEWLCGVSSLHLCFPGIIAKIKPKLRELFCYSILLVLCYTYNNERFSFMQPNVPQLPSDPRRTSSTFPVSKIQTVGQPRHFILSENTGIHMTSKKTGESVSTSCHMEVSWIPNS